MKKEAYRTWLDGTIKTVCIKDRISRCARVEAALGVDLDEEYKKDKGKSVLELLHYTLNDWRTGTELPKCLKFKEGANTYQIMTDMRSAATRYFDFCAATSNKKSKGERHERAKTKNSK